jgi:hypothetical protein
VNAASLDRFSKASHQSARGVRGATAVIGEANYNSVVYHGSTTVENDRGGESTVRTMVIHISRTDLPDPPAVGTRITDLESGVTGEIYEVAGRGLPYHILRAASHPDKTA